MKSGNYLEYDRKQALSSANYREFTFQVKKVGATASYGPVSTHHDNRIFNRPLNRLLRLFALFVCSLAQFVCSLHGTPLCIFPLTLLTLPCLLILFMGSLTYFARFPMGHMKFKNMCSPCKRV